MNIYDWFNPNDVEHLKAYNYLMNTGFWPKDFIPKDVVFSSCWQSELTSKMAAFWVKEKLNLNG